jgi:hypothetical protein
LAGIIIRRTQFQTPLPQSQAYTKRGPQLFTSNPGVADVKSPYRGDMILLIAPMLPKPTEGERLGAGTGKFLAVGSGM